MIFSGLRWIYSIAFISFFLFCNVSLHAQSVELADLGAVSESIYKTSKQKVYGMRISATGTDVTLTQLTSQTTGGNYTTADISNFNLYYNTVNDFTTATQIGTSGASIGAGEVITFSTSQVIPADGAYRYLFIAANVRTTAVTGRTFNFSFFAAGNFTFSPFAGISASLGGSGTKTIQPDAFVTTWKTDILIPGDRAITINSQGSGQFYNVTWAEVGNPGNNGFINNRNTVTTITFPVAGTYQVVITGTFPRINNGGDGLNAAKLISIDHWGTNAWTSMDGAFSQCTHVINNATDAPNLTAATSLHQMFSSASLVNEGNWNWNLSNITDISEMFSFASSFDQDISGWNVSNVTNMTSVFTYATSFNQDINNWNVSNVTDMHSMFRGAVSFNQSLDNWNVSNVTQMYAMFSETTSFNQSLTTWNVSQVIDLYAMFENATAFNGDIGNWSFSNVLLMDRMFSGASSFNRDISAWNTSSVVSTRNMFSNATIFNQNISSWNVGNVTDMSYMFQQANSFNQNIGNWNVSKVIYMDNMFESNTAFNQNLAAWNVSTVASMNGMFDNSALSGTNYDNLLIGWASLPSLQSDVTLGATGIKYCAGESARASINASYNWFFNDGGRSCAVAITSISPTSGPQGTTLTINGSGFNASGPNIIFFGTVHATANANTSGTSINVSVPSGITSVTPIQVINFSNKLQASSLTSTTPFFTVTTSPALPLQPSNYTQTDYLTPVSASIASADFDNDGLADLVATNLISGGLDLYQNDGTGKFNAAWPRLSSAKIFNVQVADLNSDGYMDIIGAPTETSDLILFKNDEDGDFITLPDITGVSGNGAGLAIIDVDNDGKVDLITSNQSNRISVLKGDGTGNFVHATNSPYIITGTPNFGYLSVADFNNDQYADIAVVDGDNALLYLMLNKKNGTFDTPTTVAVSASPFQVVAGRFDSDVFIDLAVLSISGNISILKGNGIGGFTPFAGSPVNIGGSPLGIAAGDFDGDGFTDLSVSGNTLQNISLLKGNGTGGFTSFTGFPYVVGDQTYGIITADFNNDGKADIATANYNSSVSVLLYQPVFISSFTPTSAGTGATVTITGNGFTGATDVSFGGANASSFTVVNATTITATIGVGATGDVVVTTPAGTATLSGFVYTAAPTITSFTPTSAASGATVTITGTNFTGATAVNFGGTSATSFAVVNATTITAIIANGTSGIVTVTTPGGTATSATNFTFIAAPTITSFTPTSAASGTTVTITGTNFTGTTAINFGGTAATSFTVVNATTITATVANGSSGAITVTTPGGTATSSTNFTFIATPSIASFTPTSAASGATVTITGTNFTGATAVTFGGTAATSFTVVNATTITATVADGTSGPVTVTTPNGTATSATNFTFIAAPTITSFTPTSAASGATVTITGTNFTGATTVSFGGTSATSFNVVNATTITATIANGSSGNVRVTTAGGTVSQSGFTFIPATIPVVKDGDNNTGPPIISQQSASIDIGETFVGNDLSKTFSIDNVSSSAAVVTSVTLDNTNFVIEQQPTTIAAGSFARLTVRLKAEQVGVYNARITIQYQSGSFEFNITGEVRDPSIIVYNAVTPNGDGNNDFLKIVNIELYPDNTVTIINRLGEAVFKANAYSNSDPSKYFTGQGNTGPGQNLIDGTYYYIIDIGTSEKITGFLLLQK